MIDYLKSQFHRMNSEQKSLVERCAQMPDDRWIKIERDRLTTLYMWLHMSLGQSTSDGFELNRARKNIVGVFSG